MGPLERLHPARWCHPHLFPRHPPLLPLTIVDSIGEFLRQATECQLGLQLNSCVQLCTSKGNGPRRLRIRTDPRHLPLRGGSPCDSCVRSTKRVTPLQAGRHFLASIVVFYIDLPGLSGSFYRHSTNFVQVDIFGKYRFILQTDRKICMTVSQEIHLLFWSRSSGTN